MLGVMPLNDALAEAEQRSMDLVEVAPKANPPVCRIMNFGQFIYNKKKIDQKNKKKQKQTEVKGIRIGFRIGEHDLEIKRKKAVKFISDGNLVKTVMIIKGREINYVDHGVEMLKNFAESLHEIAQVYQEPNYQGNQITMIISPKK